MAQSWPDIGQNIEVSLELLPRQDSGQQILRNNRTGLRFQDGFESQPRFCGRDHGDIISCSK